MQKLKNLAGVFCIALALIPAKLLAETEYYTWVDENGVTNYAEKQPSGYDARFVGREARFGYNMRPRADETEASEPSSSPGADTESESPENTDDVDRMVAEERARVDAEIAAAKRSNCEIGRRNLAQLEAYARIRVKDDDGEERVLTDAEKAERIKKARQTVRENCSG